MSNAVRRVGYAALAEYLGGIPPGSLRSLVANRRIPHVRIGPRTVLFDLDAIDAWLAERSVPARDGAPMLRLVGGGK